MIQTFIVMKVKPLDKVICRTPVFGIHTHISTVFNELLDKIKESSPEFASLIEPFSAAELNQLGEKAKYTLWKYFNRARYRSTPFGSFAAVTVLPLQQHSTAKIVISKTLKIKHFTDWTKKAHYLEAARKKKIAPSTCFLSNSSFYFTGDEIRYLKVKNNIHELAAVSAIPELSALLLTCKRKTTAEMIFDLLRTGFDMDDLQTTNFLQQLIEMQLLISDQHPNLIGTDYFERLQVPVTESPENYMIANRTLNSGNFSQHDLKDFPAWVNFCAQQFGPNENPDLENFKQHFLKRFENQEVSLAFIMDPEIGLGYGNLAQQQHSNLLVNEIKQARMTHQTATIAYSPFHAFLLNKIVDGSTIKIHEFRSESKPVIPALPNTFSFIFHRYHNQPVIAYGGGSTANALIGRFTLASDEVEKAALEIAALEKEANPGVDFFDISYQAEGKIDNVNRRKSLYAHELPLLTWSEHPSPLDLNDILVSVQQDQVILKSRKLGRRIIPRVPSAYNYTRSDLSVYRFLCDVKNQGLATQFAFRLQDLFPKLSFYPRACFHQLIVSPATWLVPDALYQSKLSQADQLHALRKWLKETGIDFKFRSGFADATLCFDPSVEEDLWAMLHFCRQQKSEVYISEALIEDTGCIEDETKQLYFPQYIVNFCHEEAVYQPLPVQRQSQHKTTHVQLPGGDWLYFELYSHALKGNSILLNQVQQLIKSNQRTIRKWFFIRYNQPGPHLRLRLQLRQKAEGFKIITALKSLVEPEMQTGSISDVKIRTYFRETHRYGLKRMNVVEQFFALDSRCILYLLTKAVTDDQLLINSLRLLSYWLDKWLPDMKSQLNFVKQMATAFDLEMQISTDHFKKINAGFKALKAKQEQLQLKIPLSILKSYDKLLITVLSTCKRQGEEEKLMADLIHMHINRLFATDQRTYETLIYHFLMRQLQMKRATAKAEAEC